MRRLAIEDLYAPLGRQYTDYDAREHRALEDYKSIPSMNDLHPNNYERASAKHYVGLGYEEINGHLHSPESSTPREEKENEAHVRNFDNLISRSPGLSDEKTTYRGVSNSHKQFGEPGRMIGKRYRTRDFQSSTTHYDAARNWAQGAAYGEEGDKPGVIVQHLPKGHKTITIDNEGEMELLHPRGTRWQVMADHDFPSHREIHVRPVTD